MAAHSVGQSLKGLRQACGLTQRALAERLGVSSNYLSMVENGRREPSLDLMTEAARALNVPAACLFWDPDVNEGDLGPDERELVSKLRSLLMEFHMSLLKSRRASREGGALSDE